MNCNHYRCLDEVCNQPIPRTPCAFHFPRQLSELLLPLKRGLLQFLLHIFDLLRHSSYWPLAGWASQLGIWMGMVRVMAWTSICWCFVFIFQALPAWFDAALNYNYRFQLWKWGRTIRRIRRVLRVSWAVQLIAHKHMAFCQLVLFSFFFFHTFVFV